MPSDRAGVRTQTKARACEGKRAYTKAAAKKHAAWLRRQLVSVQPYKCKFCGQFPRRPSDETEARMSDQRADVAEVEMVEVYLTFDNVTRDDWPRLRADLMACDPFIIDIEGIPEEWETPERSEPIATRPVRTWHG